MKNFIKGCIFVIGYHLCTFLVEIKPSESNQLRLLDISIKMWSHFANTSKDPGLEYEALSELAILRATKRAIKRH